MTLLAEQKSAIYTSQARWTPERPRVLVACCSDGRLQEAIDEFLQTYLSVVDYDRFYALGEPEEATCAHYKRILPGVSAERVREQHQDLADLKMYLDGLRLTVRVRAFRAEVLADKRVQFVPMI